VVNPEEFIKNSFIPEGNIAVSKTLAGMSIILCGKTFE
jgi:hypothetical protein